MDLNLYRNLINEASTKAKKLDYYLIINLYKNKEKEILSELKKFQNDDGGFGHGLEGDIRMPGSNVASSDVAIAILDEISDLKRKEPFIKSLVKYYEDVYDKEKLAWEIVPKAVNEHPRAVWWNYESIESFTYGNPNPEIAGFLYQHRKYLKTLDIDQLIDNIVTYLETKFPEEKSQHSIISSLHFYVKMPDDIKARIKPILQVAIDEELKTENWNEYCLEPYTVYNIAPEFLEGKEEALEKNLEFNLKKLENGLVMPNWEWYQFPEVFEKVKNDWCGLLTFGILKAIKKHDEKMV